MKMGKKGIILVSLLILQIVSVVYALEVDEPSIFFVFDGYDREYYLVYDAIVVSGGGFEPSSDFTVALVGDVELADGMEIPDAIPDTLTVVSSDPDGNVADAVIWDVWGNSETFYLPAGVYNLIVDLDGDGVYDEGADLVAVMSVGYWAGFGSKSVPMFAAPEYPVGSVMAIAAFLMAAFLVRSKKIV
jgi:hypothetical protein